MKSRISKLSVGILAAALIGQGAIHRGFIFNNWARDYSPASKGKGLVSKGLDPLQMIFALAGFREMIAGILWVRADAFFDSGNYDAILPIIRLVTLLDPSEIDVYATGMWHIGYNFTDEEQRSDRRYLPSALALGKEGAANNPATYEMFFETGWMWYHKIDDDYGNAVNWFEQAQKREDMIAARKNLLGMAYQRNGEIEKGLGMYQMLFKDAQKRYQENSSEYSNRQNRDVIEQNIDTMLVRMVQRGYIAEKEGRSLKGYDVYPPFDVGFSVKATVVEPRVIKFEGTWNVLPVGTRIRVTLRDSTYTAEVDGKQVDVTEPAGLKWDYSNDVNLDPPRDRTFMQDQLFVRNRRFNRKVDMSKDPTMYPFTSPEYVLEFYYNPRSAPPHIQDKFSWNGEGLTDKNYLNTQVRPGQRVVYARMILTRDQILRRGEWFDKPPVVETPNYKEVDRAVNSEDVVVDIPSLRAGGK
jgi:tetratricopeptide (TPR) repeat protein